MLAALLPLTPPAAYASSTYFCTGYSGCQGNGYTHFGYRRASSRMWWQMFPGHNCTNYVAYRLVRGGMSATRPWSGTGMAYNWGHAKRRITDHTPRVGAVAWWDRNVTGAGSSGHVAYVEKVISPRRIVISEDSWSGDFHWRRIVKSGGGWPSGFIHFNDREITARERPRITGQPEVGTSLVATAGRWSVDSRHDFQWLADGKPIAGATSSRYTPRPDLRGSRLSVRVSASRRGYIDGSSTSEQTTRVTRGTMEVESSPTVTGPVRVGEVLSVRGAAWSPRPDSTSIQWYAGQDPIAGERGAQLHLAPGHLGKRIWVRVTARREGYRRSAVVTPRTSEVALGHFEITRPFELTGGRRLGGRLEVAHGRFSPSEATRTYTWLRDGRAIPGATGTSYVPGLDDVGERISVQVHLQARGYLDRTVQVRADGPITTRPTVSVWTEGRPGRAIVRLKVTAPGVGRPGGRVTVRSGGHDASGRLDDGRLRLVVSDLRSGLRTLRVRYYGTTVVMPESTVTTVRVPRR